MKKTFMKLSKFITSFFAIFAIIFTMSTIIFAATSQYVYESVGFFKELLVITGISAAMSIIIVLFLQINKISVILQVIIIYCFVFWVIFVMGYFLYIYDFYNNERLLISTLVFFVIGLICMIVIQTIYHKKSNDSLNANLKQFKERDK